MEHKRLQLPPINDGMTEETSHEEIYGKPHAIDLIAIDTHCSSSLDQERGLHVGRRRKVVN
jgi:hypothetical protein